MRTGSARAGAPGHGRNRTAVRFRAYRFRASRPCCWGLVDRGRLAGRALISLDTEETEAANTSGSARPSGVDTRRTDQRGHRCWLLAAESASSSPRPDRCLPHSPDSHAVLPENPAGRPPVDEQQLDPTAAYRGTTALRPARPRPPHRHQRRAMRVEPAPRPQQLLRAQPLGRRGRTSPLSSGESAPCASTPAAPDLDASEVRASPAHQKPERRRCAPLTETWPEQSAANPSPSPGAAQRDQPHVVRACSATSRWLRRIRDGTISFAQY